MKVRVTDTYEDMSDAALSFVVDQVRHKPDSVLGLAAGSTPLLLYQKMCDAMKEGTVDFSRIRTFCLDEYIGLSPEAPQSYHSFMKKELFDGLGLPPERTRIPDGMAADIARECAMYGAEIEAAGGIDLVILGIGQNAHIGFNEPGDTFVPETHVVELSEATRQANARFFDSLEETPHWAVSMGIRDIMLSRNILLLASGAGKTEALYQAVCGDITPKAPASILQLHRNVLVLADKAAVARMPTKYLD
ncbi:MAG: glucosamine-6-phosphate deaminase [Schwartzia sp.]|nr:glucosamine-6-phosphate deaminase [Schwartzia sp. (in: firmicutes)]